MYMHSLYNNWLRISTILKKIIIAIISLHFLDSIDSSRSKYFTIYIIVIV